MQEVKCRSCGSERLLSIVKFGITPLADALLTREGERLVRVGRPARVPCGLVPGGGEQRQALEARSHVVAPDHALDERALPVVQGDEGLGDEDPNEYARGVGEVGSTEVLVEVAHHALADLFHAGCVRAQAAQLHAAAGHVAEGESAEIEHFKAEAQEAGYLFFRSRLRAQVSALRSILLDAPCSHLTHDGESSIET